MEEEYVPKKDHHSIKLLKKISRELNQIPPNKTISLKPRYKRKKKHTREYLAEIEDEVA